MKVAYLIQTHKNPDQIDRLVHTIKRLSPTAQVVVNHDFTHCKLDESRFARLSDVQILPSRGGRGNFAIVQSYLDAIEWLLQSGSQFDWLINLSGQDYPIRPLSQVETRLAETPFDGFMLHFEVFSNQSHWRAHEGYTRYFYHYRTLVNLTEPQKEFLKPIKLLNYIQPFFRVNVSYGLTLGMRISTPFSQDFKCYGGSYLCTLSRKCVEYLADFVQSNPDIVAYYKGVAIPDESFIQTILLNSRLFRISSDYRRYFDFSRTQNGHPRVLSSDDFASLAQSQDDFARKFDLTQDSRILDLIDHQLLAAPIAADAGLKI